MEGFTVSKKEFKTMMEVLPITLKDSYKHFCKCVCFTGTDVVVLDGHRLAIRKMKVKLNGTYIILGEKLKRVVKDLTGEVKSVTLRFTQECVYVVLLDAKGVDIKVFKFEYERCEPISYHELIPTKFNGLWEISKQELKGAINKTNEFIVFEFIGGRFIEVFNASYEYSRDNKKDVVTNSIEFIQLEKSIGSSIRIGFSKKYLKQAIRNIEGNIIIRYTSNLTAAIITDSKEPSRLELILPIRL